MYAEHGDDRYRQQAKCLAERGSSTPTEVEAKSILGTKVVPGFVLEITKYYPATHWQPEEYDYAEVGTERNFGDIVLLALKTWCRIKHNATWRRTDTLKCLTKRNVSNRRHTKADCTLFETESPSTPTTSHKAQSFTTSGDKAGGTARLLDSPKNQRKPLVVRGLRGAAELTPCSPLFQFQDIVPTYLHQERHR